MANTGVCRIIRVNQISVRLQFEPRSACLYAGINGRRFQQLVDSVLPAEVEMRPVRRTDFDDALCLVRASVSQKELAGFEEWNAQFGSFQRDGARQQAPV